LFSKVEIEVRGHDRAVLNSYSVFVKTVANELGLKLTTSAPDRFIERWSILKSRFSNRKHMRQYEMRTHFLKFNFQKLTGSTCSTLLEYIERNLPAGVAMHVHQTRLSLLPFEIEVKKKKEASQATTPS
jgi:small subunit ribosomal protein S10